MKLSAKCRDIIGVASLVAAFAAGPVAASDTPIRVELGHATPGQTIALDLDRIVAPAQLIVAVDGAPVTTPFGVDGDTLLLRLPDDLRGNRHDITVFQTTPAGPEEIGTWQFDTSANDWRVSGAVLSFGGTRSAEGRSEDFFRQTGRFDLALDENRVRGRLNYVLAERADPDTGDRLTIPDWFLETNTQLGGTPVRLRAGAQDWLSSAGLLIDTAERRGLSLRLGTPGGRASVTAYAAQASLATGPDNLAGLADGDDMVYGLNAHVFPLPGQSLRLDLSAYEGRATDADGLADARGTEIALSGPVGERADFLLSVSQSGRNTGNGWETASALSGELVLGLLPPGEARSLSLTLGYDRIEQAFHAPLNSLLIPGEETYSLALDYGDDVWTWSLETDWARTSVGGADRDPVDHLGRVGFALAYAPDVFTGGFMNGTTFYVGAELLTQDRHKSPDGSAAPTDNTIRRFSAGFDKFQPDYSIGMLYTHDSFDDRTGGGGDETVQGVTARASYTGLSRLNVVVGATAELTDGDQGRWWKTSSAAALSYELIPDRLEYAFEAGFTRYDGRDEPEGGYVRQELSQRIFEGHDLVLSAEFGHGIDAPRLVTNQGWAIGLALRSDVGF